MSCGEWILPSLPQPDRRLGAVAGQLIDRRCEQQIYLLSASSWRGGTDRRRVGEPQWMKREDCNGEVFGDDVTYGDAHYADRPEHSGDKQPEGREKCDEKRGPCR